MLSVLTTKERERERGRERETYTEGNWEVLDIFDLDSSDNITRVCICPNHQIVHINMCCSW